MNIKAVIFDLDGVVVSTDEYHYLAWKSLAEGEGIPFDRKVNERLRGVSRRESLDIVLSAAERAYSEEEKNLLAERKNLTYQGLLGDLGPRDILPGVSRVLADLRARGIATAIGSSSRNAKVILERVGLARAFDAVADGTDITKSKPDPEVFLVAARRLGVEPANCLVVEDASSGVEAALSAGMFVVGVGSARSDPRVHFAMGDLSRWDEVIHLA